MLVLMTQSTISQYLEIGRANLLFFEKRGVRNVNLKYFYHVINHLRETDWVQFLDKKYFCLCIADKTGCPFSKLGIPKTPKGITS